MLSKFRWPEAAPLLIVAGVILVALAPLPAWVMDLLVTANLTAAVLILLTALRVRSALEFNTFPIVLIAATMARLALNLASTRLILTDGSTQWMDAAGGVIRAFGEFVAGDQFFVGLAMFGIIVTIQFVVITKGAERVSEVAARFALDALPGRQAAIDADVATGALSHGAAQRKRRELSTQADFYGAMDGASKFVRGDAIAGLVITGMNLAGGLAMGVFQGDMPWRDAWSIYAKLAIGDGLASQTPAVLTAIAAAILVTRNSQRQSLTCSMHRQLLAKPESLVGSAALLAALLFTDLPKTPLLVLGGGCLAMALLSTRTKSSSNEDRSTSRELAAAGNTCGPVADSTRGPRSGPSAPPSSRRLEPQRLELVLGRGLIRIAGQGGVGWLPHMTAARERMSRELGVLLPAMRIRDDRELPADAYVIALDGNALGRARLPKGLLFEMHHARLSEDLLDAVGPPWRHPAWSHDLYVAPPTLEPVITQAGARVVDPAALVVAHLCQLTSRFADEMLSRDGVRLLLEQYFESRPDLREDLQPRSGQWGILHQVMGLLLREQTPVRQLDAILETISDAPLETSPRVLAERVRRRLARSICASLWDQQQRLPVIALDPAWERDLIEQQPPGEVPETLRLDAEDAQRLQDQLREAWLRHPTRRPVILTAAPLRPGLRRLLESQAVDMAVMSYDEITRDSNVQILQVIGALEGVA